MKKTKNIIKIVFFAFIVAGCENDSRPILGKWKLDNIVSKNGEIELTFFSRNIFTIVYSANNKLQTQIQNTGVWKLDGKTNIVELKNDNDSSLEKYQIELLNQDSLIWRSLNKKGEVAFQSKLFLKIE